MLKKRLIYIIFLLLASTVAFAQQYKVCDVSSAPAAVKRANEEVVLRNTILDSKERLNFAKYSKISLMETKSKDIFFFTGEGELTVAEIVKSNKKKIKSNQKAHVKDLMLGKSHTKLAGVVYKDLEMPVRFLEDGCVLVVDENGTVTDQKDIKPQEIYYFVVSNTSDYPLFVNVISTDARGNSKACCVSNDASAQLDLLVVDGGEVMLSAFPQLGKDLANSTFKVAASEYPFDIAEFMEKSPSIKLVSPPDKSILTYPDITLRFLVKNCDKAERVYVLLNGEDTGANAGVAEDINEVKVKLVKMGENIMEIGVVDIYGNTHSKKISVNYGRVNKPKLHILSVGIGNYRSNKVDKLHYAASDAAMVFEVLDTLRDMNLHLYNTGGYRKLLVEEEATRGNILKCMDDLRAAADPEDIAMVYMSGHGKTVEFTSQRYFLPYDMEDSYVESTAISYADLKNKLKELEDKECKVIIYMDACYAGEMYYTKGASDFIGDADPAVIGFYSSTSKQPSLEKKELGHGVFTYALLNGIKGGAGDENGNVTISSLGEFITEQVRIESDGRQSPKVDNGGEDFILFKVSEGEIKVAAPVRAVPKTETPAAHQGQPLHNDPVIALAESYYSGTAVAATAQDEFNAYLAAAEKGDVKSMYYVGVCHETGRGCSPDARKAFAWYAKAATGGVAAAQYNLGVMHLNGTGTPPSTVMAAKWLGEAEKNGYAKASTILGVLYYTKENPEYAKAFGYFSKGAKDGDPMALYYLGECYWNGRGTSEDVNAAMQAYTESAGKGYQPASERLMEIDF